MMTPVESEVEDAVVGALTSVTEMDALFTLDRKVVAAVASAVTSASAELTVLASASEAVVITTVMTTEAAATVTATALDSTPTLAAKRALISSMTVVV